MESIQDTEEQPATSPEADEGVQFFLEGVRHLPGVQRVEVAGGRSPADQSLVVYISEGDLETERRVYRLEADAYHRFPDLRLDVWVENSDTGEAIPPAPVPSVEP
jgi:hypothetical protein